MDPTGTPKGTQNRLKSAKMLPGTLPESVWRRSLEKVASRSLPETSPYASRTIKTMVFALPTRRLWEAFWLPFGHLGRPKVGQKRKRDLQKNSKKTTRILRPPGLQNDSKMTSKRVGLMAESALIRIDFGPFWSKPNWFI